MEMKRTESVEEFCSGLPDEFVWWKSMFLVYFALSRFESFVLAANAAISIITRSDRALAGVANLYLPI